MKKNFILLLTYIITGFSTVTADHLLITADNLVEKKDFCVLQQVGNSCIIIADNNDLKRLDQRRSPYKILDNNPREKKYYLVHPLHEHIENISGICTILQEFHTENALKIMQKSVLVSVSEENEKHLFDLPVSLDYLEMDNIKFNTAVVPKMSKYTVSYNPLIQQMVDSVSMDTLRAFVTYLEDSVSSRSARQKSNLEQSIPWICNKFREYGCDSVFQQEVPDQEYAPNPIGIKLGTEYPSYTQYYIMGAHPDAVPHESENKGADDNASGIASVIEAARVMRNYSFKYTIIYMGFDGEEIGLLGSSHFASEAEARGDTILGVLATDMIGRTSGSSDYLRVYYNSSITGCEAFGNLYDDAAAEYTDLNYSVRSSEMSGSDHSSFWKKGFIALFVIESAYGSNDANHKSWDTLDCPEGLNDSEFMTQSTQANIAAIASAAEVIDQTSIESLPWQKPDKNSISIFRNPSGNILINFQAPEKEEIVLKVYGASGKLISTVASGMFQKGTHTIQWNGCDSEGKKISRGLYLFECSSNKRRQISKCVY